MSRLLCCCVLLLASPAAAEIITVEDGQSFDRINVTPERELVMNGGHVELVRNTGGLVTVNGGTAGLLRSEETPSGANKAYVSVNGYKHNSVREDKLQIEIWGGSHVQIHGYNFRANGYGNRSTSDFDIHGWLIDGSFAEIRFRRYGSAEGQSLNLVAHETAFVDPTGDWNFDLSDLNMVRNNFGSQGDGDTNSDGVIDLVDLNIVRNKFGSGYFQEGFPVEWEYSGEIPLNPNGQWYPPLNPVPEPSAMALGFFALAGIPLQRRCRSWLRRFP